jgi:hypothetical protein
MQNVVRFFATLFLFFLMVSNVSVGFAQYDSSFESYVLVESPSSTQGSNKAVQLFGISPSKDQAQLLLSHELSTKTQSAGLIFKAEMDYPILVFQTSLGLEVLSRSDEFSKPQWTRYPFKGERLLSQKGEEFLILVDEKNNMHQFIPGKGILRLEREADNELSFQVFENWIALQNTGNQVTVLTEHGALLQFVLNLERQTVRLQRRQQLSKFSEIKGRSSVVQFHLADDRLWLVSDEKIALFDVTQNQILALKTQSPLSNEGEGERIQILEASPYQLFVKKGPHYVSYPYGNRTISRKIHIQEFYSTEVRKVGAQVGLFSNVFAFQRKPVLMKPFRVTLFSGSGSVSKENVNFAKGVKPPEGVNVSDSSSFDSAVKSTLMRAPTDDFAFARHWICGHLLDP